MPHADQPAGPGRPTQERRDAVSEREELDAMDDEARGRAERDPTRDARHAERDAHVEGEGSTGHDSRPGRHRPGGA